MKINVAYKQWLIDLKSKIRSTQIKAAIAVNSELIKLYWELGKMITEKETVWGSKLIEQVSKDLKEEFSEMKGLSRSNLFYAKKFYLFYNDQLVQQPVGLIDPPPADKLQNIDNDNNTLVQQLVALIPWGHNILIFTKSATIETALFYLNQTIENQWSRETLKNQLNNKLHERQGKAISNFKHTLSEKVSTLAQQTLKDPYIFDFLSLDIEYRERDIEDQLVQHVSKFLLELGKGFAFIGQQYPLKVADNDYYLDLLFYHTRLKCYIVIELKNTCFQPEYTGKLNFYLSAVDSLVKMPDDNPTMGLLLCKEKKSIEAEFALRDIYKPIGVSEYIIAENLPEDLKSSLPTIEEIEREFENGNE